MISKRIIYGSMKETRSVPIGLRVKPSLKAKLDAAAEAADRPLASLVEQILRDYFENEEK